MYKFVELFALGLAVGCVAHRWQRFELLVVVRLSQPCTPQGTDRPYLPKGVHTAHHPLTAWAVQRRRAPGSGAAVSESEELSLSD